MDFLILLLIAAVLIFVYLKVPFGTVLFVGGILVAIAVGAIWWYVGKGDKNDTTSPGVKPNFKPISLVLRIALAVVLYFFLCKAGLLPKVLTFVPEFLSPLMM